MTTPFEAACWGAINQRIQLGVARGMKEALCRRLGGSIVAGGAELLAFPEAATIAAAGEGELRAVLGNERKARVIAALSTSGPPPSSVAPRADPRSEGAERDVERSSRAKGKHPRRACRRTVA